MTGVLIVTHNNIGAEILKAAEIIVGKTLPFVRTVSVPGDLLPQDLGQYADQIKSDINNLDQSDGILILTDLLGATPSNLAHYFASEHHVKIVAGLNLPMLIRIINYCDQPLDLLAKIGIVGANKGISKEMDI